ncbi:MAG: sugar ABC transporter permease [Alphaproteobacteria bacterium]
MTVAKELPGARTGASSLQRLTNYLEIDTRLLVMIAVLVAIAVGFELATGGFFLTVRNLFNLSLQTSVVAIMATGMVLIIVSRHIDLSVGSLMGFAGMLAAVLQVWVFPVGAGYNWIVTLVLCILFGAVLGAFQGYWIAYRMLPSFIVTLAGLLAWRGASWLVSGGVTISPMDETFQKLGGGLEGTIGETWSWVVGGLAIIGIVFFFVQNQLRKRRYGFRVRPLAVEAALIGLSIAVVVGFVMTMNAYLHPVRKVPQGIPIPVLILIVIVIAMSLVARITKFGRYVYAMGGNPDAAELAGIDVKRMTFYIFVLSGVLCAIAGAIAVARLNAAPTSLGQLSELNVIAAAVIGGASLSGGVGTVAGAILGALIMQSLQNGMLLIGITSAIQQMVSAGVLILAVWFDVVYQKRRLLVR